MRIARASSGCLKPQHHGTILNKNRTARPGEGEGKAMRNRRYILAPTLHIHESSSARFAANINALVSIVEAVELCGGALGVSTHILEVQPVADVNNLVEANTLGDAVNSVAGRTPNRILDTLIGRAGSSIGIVVEGLSCGAEDVRDRMLVVKHDAREVAVDAVVDVDHVTFAVKSRVFNGAASDDVAGNGEGRSDIVASRLGNDVNVGAGGEELIEGSVEDTGHLFKGVTGEATADIKSAHVEPVGAGLLEDSVRIAYGGVEGHRVRCTGTDVEANADNGEAELLGKSEKALSGIHGSTKLHAETAQAGRIVGHDAQEKLSAREELSNLMELVGVVKGHLLDAGRLDVADVRVGLARLGVDDAVGARSHGEDLVDLGFGSAIEACAKLGKQAKDLGVGVALNGVEGADARQILLPAKVLAVDLA